MSSAPAHNSRRVVITGIGVVAPLGNGSLAEFWNALASGQSGVGACEHVPGEKSPLKIAAEAKYFTGDIANFGELEADKKKGIRKGLKVMCRETQMAIAAAEAALTDSGCRTGLDPERAGVVLGSDYMLTVPIDYEGPITKCADGGQFEYSRWGKEGLREMQPLWMLKYLPNMPASHIAILNDLRGPNNSLTMREASSLMAIGEAFRTIARGHADVMVAGATGTRVLPMQAIHALQTEEVAADGDPATASRPFDANRRGMVCGEGAGMVVLEALETATARGAKIYGEILGFGTSQVADRQLRGDGTAALTNAMHAALHDAKTSPSDVGHLNSHGLATRVGDAAEAQAIAAVFGERAKSVPLVALKSSIGNLGAGGGAVELAGSLLAIQAGELPRVLNCDSPDAACAPVTKSGVSPGRSFLATNVTPQGQAAAILVAAVK